MTKVYPAKPARCEICEGFKRVLEPIETKMHGSLMVCARCRDWARANFLVKK